MKKKVLIIEDDPAIRENTAELLELSGYQVSTAENGKVGLDLARTDLPDIIFSDIIMPELDGFGLLHILQRSPETAGIPFVFMTSLVEKRNRRKGMEMGADDYLTKPFDHDEILSIIETRLRRQENRKSLLENSIEDEKSALQETEGWLTELVEDRESVKYDKGEFVFRRGEYPVFLYFVKRGKVKVYKMNEDGKQFLTSIPAEGEYFGYKSILEERPYRQFAEALEDCEICRIPKEDFLASIAGNQQITLQLARKLSGEVSDKDEALMRLAYDSVRQRVANSILTLANYNEEEKGDVSISRSDLAGIVGTAKETLARVLSDFREEEVIETERFNIKVLEKEKLARIANL